MQQFFRKITGGFDMNGIIRTTAALMLAATGCGGTQVAMAAQPGSFPERPIRFIVGFAPGGGNDTMARMLGQRVAARLGQSVVIDNRAGAGGNLAAEIVSRAVPDGHTILMVSSSHPIQGLLKKHLSYDPIKDFSGLAQMAVYRSILVVNPAVAIKSVRDLITLAKAKPGSLNFVSAGGGTGSHLGGELFKAIAGVDLTHVPYKGTAPAVTDLVAGRVEMMFTPMMPVYPHIKSGRLRAVAVTSSNRSRLLPELPTVAESGVPGYEYVAWYGVLGPAAIPKPVVGRLNATINEVMQLTEIKDRLQAEDMDLMSRTPEQFDAIRAAEVPKWEKIVKQLGLQVD